MTDHTNVESYVICLLSNHTHLMLLLLPPLNFFIPSMTSGRVSRPKTNYKSNTTLYQV